MTTVLLWKEYRQQRAVWLAMAFLAVFLVVTLAETLRSDPQREAFQIIALACLTVAFGIVSGALLLAGDRDDGALDFLDRLTPWRSPLFVRKLIAGLLFTLSLNLFLAGLVIALDLAPEGNSWEIALLLPVFGLDALIWGLLAGALCRKVLTAGLVGIALLALSWPLAMLLTLLLLALLTACGLNSVPSAPTWAMVASKLIVDGTGGYLAWHIYCRNDFSRQTPRSRLRFLRVLGTVFSWRVLVWLAFRQGRWVLATGLGVALLLVLTIIPAPVIVWPVGSLLLGLAFGLAVFTPEQEEANRFLGAQRFPPGRIWTVKVLFWATGLLVLILLAASVGALLLGGLEKIGPLSGFLINADQWSFLVVMEANGVSLLLLVGLWPLYGFCFGQFFGQIMRRPALAVILALFLTPPVVATWVPALVLGGLPLWQVLIVPGLLLLTTRFALWPWVSGRLLSARPLFGIAGAVVLMVLTPLSCRWYRVVEVPDVGEPFDVKAFTASLPSPEENEAGRLIRKACAGMQKHREEANKQSFQEADGRTWDWWRTNHLLTEILEKGWPQQDKELSRWLDRLFAEEWAQQAEKVAQLPLGMVQDPRLPLGLIFQDCGQMGVLFVLRALQQQAHGDPRGALHDLETALALSRQVRNNARARLFIEGLSMEDTALSGFRFWLQKSGPDKELLHAALTMLQQHEAALPDPANTVKVEYLVYRDSDPTFHRSSPLVNELLRMAFQVPGERERWQRILRAVVAGQLHKLQQPTFEKSRAKGEKVPLPIRLAERCGLPLPEGPGSRLSAREWGELIYQFQFSRDDIWALLNILQNTNRGSQALHAAELAVAVTLYQADHGKPPEQLAALVPVYLPAIPDDPRTGQPFRYHIASDHESISSGGQWFTLAPGQASIESEDSAVLYLVPRWARKENQP